MAISNTILNTVGNVIYSSSGPSVVSVMYFCNNDTSDRTIQVYAAASGNVAGANNIIYKNVTISAGDTFVVDMEKLVLGNGDMLLANASANSAVTATVSYTGI